MNAIIKNNINYKIDSAVLEIFNDISVLNLSKEEREEALNYLQDYGTSAVDNCNGGNKLAVKRANARHYRYNKKHNNYFVNYLNDKFKKFTSSL